MIKEAIDKVLQLQQFETLVGQLKTANSVKPFVAVPDGYAISDLQGFMPNKLRFDQKFKTKRPRDFFKYIKNYDNLLPNIFVDDDVLFATAVFDIGTPSKPGHKVHRAILATDKTPPMKALLNVEATRCSQQVASDFLADWASLIVCFGQDGNQVSVEQAIQAVRNVDISQLKSINNQIGEMSSQRSAMEKIEAQATNNFPSQIHMSFVPRYGFDEMLFTLRVGVAPRADSVQITFRLMRPEETEDRIADNFLKIIKEGVKDADLEGLPIFFGEVS